ncbi:MAG: septum formation initiator family protein [Anaerovoracaceae bacterium]|uniref:Septum formation initiator family protein n=1 Tax=Candidatus Allocopromorpha excrementipullorum TaxID=2840743 RepID=A0A9D1N5R5_9FIRM|nr:septum formation initiator family protein [Anaerovoracaceae bacterium]HIU95595.1 septum formation initiator family protein [Candidatus Copromorpha excrementipullorum]
MEKNLLCYNQTMGKRRRSKEFKNNSQVIDMEQARAQRLEKRRAERQREEKKAQEAARRKTRGKMAIRRSRNRRRLMIGIVVMVIIGLISFSVINIISLKREQHDMEQQKQELEEEKEQLSKELENAGDLQNLEEQARDQLRLIKPGEKIYIFPEEITQTEETTEAEE